METVACNLCGCERHTMVYEMPDRRYFREEFFTVVECDRCGLGFVNPRPARMEMQKYYPPEYYQDPPTASHGRPGDQDPADGTHLAAGASRRRRGHFELRIMT